MINKPLQATVAAVWLWPHWCGKIHRVPSRGREPVGERGSGKSITKIFRDPTGGIIIAITSINLPNVI